MASVVARYVKLEGTPKVVKTALKEVMRGQEGEYKVKIDLVSYYYRDSDYNYSYGNLVSYHYYTDDDYDNAVQEKMEENAAVDNDL